MSKIVDRYASAMRSGNLASKPGTTFSDIDVVGAHGLAAKRHPLAIALQRMFLGGDVEAKAVCVILTAKAVGKAHRIGSPIGIAGADLLAGMVLQWHRDCVCKACGGHGFKVIGGKIGESRSVKGDVPCPACRGSGKRDFDSMFPFEHLELTRWLRDEVERETAKAGQAAMAALAPRLDL